MGRQLRDVYPHATKWQVFKWKVSEFVKKCVRVTVKVGMVGGASYALFMAGAYFNPTIVTAYQDKIVEADVAAPVLDRIAGCESEGVSSSKGSHYGKDGQVRVNANSNGSVDIGKYQINQRVWGAQATKLGYNLFVEKDNEDMAKWIYQNKGTEPWYSSKECWSK